MLLMSLLNVAVFSTVADFLLSDFGGLAAVDIHDAPIFTAAYDISDVNSVPVVDLPAYCCQLHYFC